jgi:hypothetical protein
MPVFPSVTTQHAKEDKGSVELLVMLHRELMIREVNKF